MVRNYGSVSRTIDASAGTSREAEVEFKLALLRAWLDRSSLAGVALTRPGPVAWLSAGLTNPIDRSDPGSPLWLVVTPSRAVAVTTAVERSRLEAEAGLGTLGFTLEDVPWFDANAFVCAAEEIAGAPWGELAPDEDALTTMRLRLLPQEQQRISELGADVALALESAVSAWRPGERDLNVQARVAERLELAGAHPVCLIVGGDERVERFRHPLAAGQPMRRLVMGVVVATRGGLHVAATRIACANGLPEPTRAAFDTALRVEAAMLGACRLGSTYGDVLRACEQAYAEAGHPGAWQEHYQGGPIGYRQREFEIAPSQRESPWFSQPIEAGHAVAWNPSLAGGGKSEDTFLVEESGLRCVTETGTWPLEEVRGERFRPGILEIAR
jgi:Xaa-Pro dipeptidase